MANLLSRLYRLLSCIAVIIIVISLVLAALANALTPFMQSQTQNICRLLSNALHRPATMASVQLRWHGINPVIHIYQLKLAPVIPAETPLHIGELDIGLSLWRSLWHHRWIFRRLNVNTMTLHVIQKPDGAWYVPETGFISTAPPSHSFNLQLVAPFLIQWPHLKVENTTVLITTQQQNWELDIRRAGWTPRFLEHYRLYGDVILHQPATLPAEFQGNIFLYGNLLQPKNWRCIMALEISHWSLLPWQSYLQWNHYQLLEGTLSHVLVEATWQQKQWQKIQLQGTLNQAQFKKDNVPSGSIGQLQHLAIDMTWQPSPKGWQLQGHLYDAGWQRWQSYPGVQHLAGYIDMTPDNGSFALNAKHLQIDFGHLFRQPLFLQNAQADIQWQRHTNSWQIRAMHMRLNNSDVSVSGQTAFSWQTGTSPFLNIQIYYRLHPSAAKNLADYLPLTLLPPTLINWLTHSIQNVQGGQGQLILQGPANGFPYTQTPGKFWVDTFLHGVTLHYWPHWPTGKNLNLSLLFQQDSMQATLASGMVGNLPLSTLSATIPALNKNAVLQLQANAITDLSVLTQWLQKTPLEITIGKKLAPMTLTGPAKLHVALELPLHDNQLPTPPVEVQGNLQLQHAQINLPRWKIALHNIHGTLHFTQNTLTATDLNAILFNSPVKLNIQLPHIYLQGKIAIHQLPSTWFNNLQNYISGTLPYHADLYLAKIENLPNTLNISSNLQGTLLHLPEPFTKKIADTRHPVQLSLRWNQHIPLTYQLTDGQLQLNLQPLGPQQWQIAITHPNVAGMVWWDTRSRAEKLTANLRYCYLPDTPTAAENNLQSALHPANLPALDITIQDFRYGKKNFGVVHLFTSPILNGLQITRLTTKTVATQFTANGSWQQMGRKNISQLNGTFISHNLSKTLQEWQMSPSIQSNHVQATFQFHWNKEIYHPSFSQLTGNVNLQIGKGRIINVNSQAKVDLGRLLTLLSFESVAQRLRLDFSDLTESGLNFDTLEGDFSLAQGNAYTNNTILVGPIADIRMVGVTDLVNERYNLQLAVTPHLTSSLPLIATIAGGPIAGAATWLADQMLNPVLNKITTDNYRVTGPWSKPMITQY